MADCRVQCAGGGRAVQQFTAQFPEIVSLLEDTGRKPQQERFIFDWIEQSCMLWRSLQGSFCFGPSDSMEIVVNSFCRQEVKKSMTAIASAQLHGINCLFVWVISVQQNGCDGHEFVGL